MGVFDKIKSFIKGKKGKEKYELPFERVIEMMKSEELFANAVKSKEGNATVVVWENTDYFNYLLNLVYKSGIQNIIKLYNSDVSTIDRNDIENYVLLQNNPEWCYEWLKAGLGQDKLKEFEKIVLDSKRPSISIDFAKDIAGANVDIHSKIVLDNGSAGQSAYFAKNVASKYTKEHLEKYIHYLVEYRSVEGKMDSDASIKGWVEDLFKSNMDKDENNNETELNYLARNTKENAEIKDYIIKYTDAKLRRRDLDSIKDRDIVVK